MADKKEKECCGTCGWWQEGQTAVVGECSVEMEGTTYDKLCDINMWKPREIPKEVPSSSNA